MSVWVIKPVIRHQGATCLGTLLSGACIELQPGNKGDKPERYWWLDALPLAQPHATGIRIILGSSEAG